MAELLTQQDLASAFKVSPRTVRRWVADGDFPRGIKVGKALRWHPDDVRRYLAHQQSESAR
ncbi:helix-turn-helix transcriptional regulator [Agrobacterium salinitolerans]|uniref:helix-turn-helix transcriptional regulator n=1 Tax=Agrobacterium salinitolerans TaxID=1183413 RepID=UPI003A0FFAEB